MKLSKISLALLASLALPAVATAGVTVTPIILGYHVSNDISDTAKKQRGVFDTGASVVTNSSAPNVTSKGNGVALDSDLYVGAGIGIELTPTIALELEYGEKSTDAYANSVSKPTHNFDAKQKMYSGNFTIGTETFTGYTNSPFKPYVLIGAGVSDISIKNRTAYTNTRRATQSGIARGTPIPAGTEVAESKDTIGNLGLGAYYRINDTLSLRGEARAIHNFDNKWWEGMALAGLNVVLGGHLAPAAAVPDVTVVEQPPVVEVVDVVDGDDDKDGVLNSADLCPNTPYNVVVDATGCPQQVPQTEDLRMELRVFFDHDKSFVKDQYKPEIAKVAEKMNEYPNATAVIEGHASKSTKRSSAKYNQRLSEARANAVKGVLVNQYGVAPARLSTVGYGFSKPIQPNFLDAKETKKNVEGQAMNRRVYATISGSKVTNVVQTKDMQ